MKTLQEYQDIVKHPGKFQGEPAYTPYFYDFLLDGDGEDISQENDSSAIRFKIESIDEITFPELSGFTHIDFFLLNNGFFVCSQLCNVK